MERVYPEGLGRFCPGFTDELVRREPSKGFETLGEVIGREEGVEMRLQLFVAFVVVAFDGCVLERAVHTLDLAVGPRMVGFGEAMLDAMLAAQPVEHVSPIDRGRAGAVLRQVAELDGVVGQHNADLVGDGLE